MEEIRLKRTGQLPLVFRGELLKKVDGMWVNGKDQNRWHEIRLYRTEQSKRYVLAIEYHSQWQGEGEQYDVLVLGPNEQEMIEVLREYEAVPEGVGYPKSEHFKERQAALEADLRKRFAVLVSDVLDDVEGAEERID
jgi:hypothetical protein